MIKFTDDFMKESLAIFGVNYKYPVFASMYIKSFFSRYKAQTGFSAVTDDNRLIVAEFSPFGATKSYSFSVGDLKSIKIKKLRLLPVYSVKSVFKENGRTFRFDMSVSLKVAGGNFPEQEQNAVNLIETLENWQNYIKE